MHATDVEILYYPNNMVLYKTCIIFIPTTAYVKPIWRDSNNKICSFHKR